MIESGGNPEVLEAILDEAANDTTSDAPRLVPEPVEDEEDVEDDMSAPLPGLNLRPIGVVGG